MIAIDPNWLIFYSGLLLIVLELIIGVDTGFDLLLVGVSFIVGALGGFLFGSWIIAFIIAIIISILYLIFGRSYLKQKLHVSTQKTNIDALIGSRAKVIRSIRPDKAGQVKVENEVWRATADESIDEHKLVKIISVEGVTLKVAQN